MSLRYAAQRYADLAGASFESVFYDLQARCGLRVGFPNRSAIVTAAANELERARRVFLAELSRLREQRMNEKRAGKRWPNAEWLAALAEAIPLGRPHARLLPPKADEVVAAPIDPAAPPPDFVVGTYVEVVLNARNRTPRRGRIERCVWHFKLGRWLYFLRQGSRKVSKRYFAEDLRPWSGEDADAC